MGRFARLTGALLLLSCASLAHADVLPEEETQCEGKQAGEACATGICADSTCNKLDYAHWDTEAGVPGTLTYACVICVDGGAKADAGAPPDPVVAVDTPEPSISDTPERPAKPEDTDSKDQKEGKSGSSSGCSITFVQTASRLGPWLLAAGFALLVSRRRRQA